MVTCAEQECGVPVPNVGRYAAHLVEDHLLSGAVAMTKAREAFRHEPAAVAQQAEQLSRKEQVGGSSPSRRATSPVQRGADDTRREPARSTTAERGSGVGRAAQPSQPGAHHHARKEQDQARRLQALQALPSCEVQAAWRPEPHAQGEEPARAETAYRGGKRRAGPERAVASPRPPSPEPTSIAARVKGLRQAVEAGKTAQVELDQIRAAMAG